LHSVYRFLINFHLFSPAEVIPVQLDLIAELKTCKDISVVGIKKLRVERAKEEVQQEQSQAKEFEKQFTYDNFLEKVFCPSCFSMFMFVFLFSFQKKRRTIFK
jgi:hypothetical protein